MRIVVGADHAGFDLKQELVAALKTAGHEVVDFGCHAAERCDYPDFASKVGEAVSKGEAPRGLLVCGTGQGMAMSANRIPGVRASVVSDTFSAHATVEHNDSNVLCLGSRVVGGGVALDLLSAWLGAEFEGGRHADRLAKMAALER